MPIRPTKKLEKGGLHGLTSPPERHWAGVIEEPQGASISVPYLGRVRKFSHHQNEKAKAGARGLPFLAWHVPRDMRGNYYPEDKEACLLGERLDNRGHALCISVTGINNERADPGSMRLCRGPAINRSGYCRVHGGALHPLDKIIIDRNLAPRHVLFKYGMLPASEMTDEELVHGKVRLEDGRWCRTRDVPRNVHDAFVNELFERADRLLKENLVAAVGTAAEIAKGTAYEPADRLAAAKWIFEQVRGKAPQTVEVKASKGFEQVMSAVLTGGSREESRARRSGSGSGVIDGSVEGVVDAEVEEMNGDFGYDDVEDDEDFVPPAPRSSVVTPRDAAEAAEVAEKRKAHKEEMKKGIAKRKAFQNKGHSTLPKPLDYEVVEIVGSDGEAIDLRDQDLAESGDTIRIKFDLGGLV